MIAKQENISLGRSEVAIKFVRDGYRAFRGKGPKYTKSLHRGRFDDSATKSSLWSPLPPLNFTQFSVSPAELELLASMVKLSAEFSGPIIEIGVLAGRTTQRLAEFKAPEQKILAVDNFCWNGWGLTPEEHWALVQHSLSYLVQTGHVEINRMDKNDFYQNYDGPAPSLVFLDAMHDYEETKKDIQWARGVGAKIICGHDYKDEFPGVMKIVDEQGGPAQLAESLYVLRSTQ